MSVYDSIDQSTLNVTWFFLGEDDAIAKFSSGGCVLPGVIAQNVEETQALEAYFNQLPPIGEAVFNPFLHHYFDVRRLRTPIEQYGYYAHRGLITFDKMDSITGQDDIHYYLIAHPSQDLALESLPQHIQYILRKNRQPIRFKDFYKLDEGYAPWARLYSQFEVPYSYPKTSSPPRKWGLDFLLGARRK